MPPGPLASAFLALAPSFALTRGPLETGSLEDALRARIDAGRVAWPALALEDITFVGHLASLVAGQALPPLDHAGEMWLACACARNIPGAARAFEHAYRDAIKAAVQRINPDLVDEVTQGVLSSLLVQEGQAAGKRAGNGAPKIALYGGRALLSTWLTTVARRAALRRRSRADRVHESVSALADVGADADPQIAMARARYGVEFDRALRASLAALDTQQRMLLRLHFVESWSIDRLAAFYRVGRSTSARRIAQAREALYEDTKRALIDRLGITPSEFHSLVALLRSDMQPSLVRLLTDDEATSLTRGMSAKT